MKSYQFWVNDGSRSFKVAAKMMYGGAKRISFIGEIR